MRIYIILSLFILVGCANNEVKKSSYESEAKTNVAYYAAQSAPLVYFSASSIAATDVSFEIKDPRPIQEAKHRTSWKDVTLGIATKLLDLKDVAPYLALYGLGAKGLKYAGTTITDSYNTNHVVTETDSSQHVSKTDSSYKDNSVTDNSDNSMVDDHSSVDDHSAIDNSNRPYIFTSVQNPPEVNNGQIQ